MRPGGPGRGKGFAEISGFFLHGGADHSVGAFTTTRLSGISGAFPLFSILYLGQKVPAFWRPYVPGA